MRQLNVGVRRLWHSTKSRSTKTGRRLAQVLTVSIVLGVAAAALPAAPAAAATGKFCGSFVQFDLFRHRACVNITSTSVSHTHTVQYLGTDGASTSQATAYYVNGVGGTCPGTGSYWFTSGQYRTFSCTTARVPGTQYMTYGRIYNASGTHGLESPVGIA
jgi:hypothetical protein